MEARSKKYFNRKQFKSNWKRMFKRFMPLYSAHRIIITTPPIAVSDEQIDNIHSDPKLFPMLKKIAEEVYATAQ